MLCDLGMHGDIYEWTQPLGDGIFTRFYLLGDRVILGDIVMLGDILLVYLVKFQKIQYFLPLKEKHISMDKYIFNPAMVSSNYLVVPRREQLRQAAASVTQQALKIIYLARCNDVRGAP